MGAHSPRVTAEPWAACSLCLAGMACQDLLVLRPLCTCQLCSPVTAAAVTLLRPTCFAPYWLFIGAVSASGE